MLVGYCGRASENGEGGRGLGLMVYGAVIHHGRGAWRLQFHVHDNQNVQHSQLHLGRPEVRSSSQKQSVLASLLKPETQCLQLGPISSPNLASQNRPPAKDSVFNHMSL